MKKENENIGNFKGTEARTRTKGAKVNKKGEKERKHGKTKKKHQKSQNLSSEHGNRHIWDPGASC